MLPTKPETLRSTHPELFKAAFPDGAGEMKLPMSIRQFRELTQITKMRVHPAKQSHSSGSSGVDIGHLIQAIGNEIRNAVGSRHTGGIELQYPLPQRRPHVKPMLPLPAGPQPQVEQEEPREEEPEQQDSTPRGSKTPITVAEATRALLAVAPTKGGSRKPTPKPKPTIAKKNGSAHVKVSYSHEASRQQFLGRCTAAKSRLFSYKNGDMKAAEQQVKASPHESMRGGAPVRGIFFQAPRKRFEHLFKSL